MGTGSFTAPSALPDFTYSVSTPSHFNGATIDAAEVWSGVVGPETVYGPAETAESLRVATIGNPVAPSGAPLLPPIQTVITFNSPTPTSGWSFAFTDLEVEQIVVQATDASGNPVSSAILTSWLEGLFDANTTDGTTPPKAWDVTTPTLPPNSGAVTSSNGPATYVTTTSVISGVPGESAGAWFSPNVSLSSITLSYNAVWTLQNASYHLFFATQSTVTLSGNVFNDDNGLTDSTVNGTGIDAPGGVQLFATLLDSDGNVVASVPVATDGSYSFSDVIQNSNYTVQLSTSDESANVGSTPGTGPSLPPGWINTGENIGTGTGDDGSPDGLLPVSVMTTDVTDVNYGIQEQLASISGTVYNDIDANAGLDGTDFGLTGITVTLTDSNGNTFTTTTESDGSYSFPDLPPDDYTVTVDTSSLPSGSTVADPSQTEDPDETGVCVVCDSITTTAITLSGGQDITDIDFGYTGDSLPVTLSSISSERLGSKIKMDWSTSSELFNVGFQLWGLDGRDNKWEKLHGWLVRSGSGNAVEAQSYSKTVNIPRSISTLIALGISSVDSDGSEHYYGPFDVGQSYGDLNQLKPISWNHIRAEVDANMVSRGYIKDRVNGYRKVTNAVSSAATDSVIEFRVSESGMYRLSAAQLLAAGIDWGDVRRGEIALLDHSGEAQVRYVSARGTGYGQNKTFGSNGEVYFYAQSPDANQGLYTNSSVYRLVLDRYQALDAQYQRKQGITSGYSEYYIERAVVEDDAQYVLTSAADDPWISRAVVGYPNKPSLHALQIPVEADALWEQGATLRLGIGRSSALTSVDLDGDGHADPEHIVEGMVLSPAGTNGLLNLNRQTATGSGEWTLDFPIAANTPLTLSEGHVIAGGAFSAGQGYALSEIHVDHIGLDYARPYIAKGGDNHLQFTAPNQSDQGYEVIIPDKGYPVVFGSDGSNLVRIGLESQIRQTSGSGEKQRLVRFAALPTSGDAEMQYWVSAKTGYLRVGSLIEKTISKQDALLAQASGSDLLLISHPAFMGDDLSRYAAFKQGQGYGVSIIDYLDVVDSFGGGQAGPTGLTRYLSQVKAQGDLAHVLLVGGSTYDHTDKLGTGAVTFIPGHYEQSSYSAYTVSDAPYVMTGNGDLMATIGRWPVRSGTDLQTMVDKSIAWSSRDHSNGQALVIAEQTVAGENIDFSAALQDVTSKLPGSWGTSRVDVDAIMEANPGLSLNQAINQAKNSIIDELNNTPDVVLYNGHATTSQLSNKGLFKSVDVSRVKASGAEVWLPMSCYMTFYESTYVNTLSHQLLFTGNAVGISGAMLLSSQGDNIAMGTAILNGSVNDGQSFGEAVKIQKTTRNNPNLTINWGYLGDPTLKM